jgi:hypothetical protein
MGYMPIVLPAPQRFGAISAAPPPTPDPEPPKPSLSFKVADAATSFLAKPYAIPLTLGAIAVAFFAIDRMVTKKKEKKWQQRDRLLAAFDAQNEQFDREAWNDEPMRLYPSRRQTKRGVGSMPRRRAMVTERGYYKGNPARERPERIEYGDRWEVVR